VSTPDIQALALAAEGNTVRQLALEAEAAKRRRTARSFGWAALALRFSWKWLAWCLALSLRRRG
jgi:hypothetical protein